MPDDKLIRSASPGDPSGLAPANRAEILEHAPGREAIHYDDFEQPDAGVDLRRYLLAVVRYKWLLVAALIVGSAGAALAWKLVQPTYLAEGSLWIEVERRQTTGDVAPIRASGLLEGNAWIEVLRSYQVLDSVVIEQGLYVQAPEEYAAPFRSLELAERFAPGEYQLEVGEDGASFTLAVKDGTAVQRGTLGEPIGQDLGFRWTPAPGSFPAGEGVGFSVLSPREAARLLSEELVTFMDREGSFLQVSLEGPNAEQVTSVLNAILDRHVALAAELKRARLDETLEILERQLLHTEGELAQAEQELEEFRVVTITLPTDQSTPIAPGLEVTRDPVIGNFFNMQVQVEQLRRDRSRLETVREQFAQSGVRIEALEVVPAAAASSELQQILAELVEARAQVRALRDRYADGYPLVRDALIRIETLEREAIPRVVDGIIAELSVQEGQVQALLDSASEELAAIPPRSIEEGRLRRRVEITGNLYNELRSRVETARLAAASSIPDVRILDRAVTPQRPTNDMRLLFAAGILFGCLGLAIGGALLLDRTDSRFRYAADVGRDIGLDILGSIPRIQTARGKRGAQNAAQALEAFRELRIHIGFAYGSAGPLTLTISSPSEGEGKSLIASNLAVAFAEVGRRTLLIDGDTRRGDAHRLVGRQRSPGLIDYLKDRNGKDVTQRTDHENLDFIGSGARGASTPELLASSRMAMFIGALKSKYDVIIVDSPPLASGGDPLILSSLTGNLAVVIRTGSTEKQLAHAKLDQLSRLPIRILGAILNDVDPKERSLYYYSTYLPGYEPVPDGDDQDGVRLIGGTPPSGGAQAS